MNSFTTWQKLATQVLYFYIGIALIAVFVPSLTRRNSDNRSLMAVGWCSEISRYIKLIHITGTKIFVMWAAPDFTIANVDT